VSLDQLDALVELVSGAWWSYLLVLAVAGLDAVFPVVPSETVVIAGGVLAASGDLRLELVIAAGAAGAFIGDNVAYAIGAAFEDRATRRFFSHAKGRRRLAWARRGLDAHGGPVLIVARFVPGGRTAVTVGAGIVGFARRVFVLYDALAVTLWAAFAALVGYVGGRAFRDDPWKALLVGLALSAVITVGAAVWRRARRGPGRRAPGGAG
jgi:membrane-associated protein